MICIACGDGIEWGDRYYLTMSGAVCTSCAYHHEKGDWALDVEQRKGERAEASGWTECPYCGEDVLSYQLVEIDGLQMCEYCLSTIPAARVFEQIGLQEVMM